MQLRYRVAILSHFPRTGLVTGEANSLIPVTGTMGLSAASHASLATTNLVQNQKKLEPCLQIQQNISIL